MIQNQCLVPGFKAAIRRDLRILLFQERNLDRNGTRIGNNPYLVEVSAIEGIDIDNPEDFDVADA